MQVLRADSGIDPKVTENYLLSQPEVVDASVFWNGGSLTAHVTLTDASEWTPHKIKVTVCDELGLHQTPRDVVCYLTRLRVA